MSDASGKSNPGHYFEDFRVGQVLVHATPRTVTDGDVALSIALTGSRYALFSSDTFAYQNGLPGAPVDPLTVFHIVFGKTVSDISLNAVANLGYAEGRALRAVYAGDTLSATSEVIGLKENSNGKTGVVYVRTIGANQHGEAVFSYVRWVMVNKKDAMLPAPAAVVPELAGFVSPEALVLPDGLSAKGYDWARAGDSWAFEDYAIGERIDHVDGMTVEEAEHQLATRLYQNTAKVHFDALAQASSRFGKRLIYGGVAISAARALAFNGLANAAYLLAINAGRHVSPLFAGDTVYAWSEVLDTAPLSDSLGALRLRLVGLKNQTAAGFPFQTEAGDYQPAVILDFDYWAAIPMRG
ncbi:MAG: MaoC family dehydratase [Caulobacterales bacterium]|jgi:2-methylfumaryl-CoA hydratase